MKNKIYLNKFVDRNKKGYNNKSEKYRRIQNNKMEL